MTMSGAEDAERIEFCFGIMGKTGRLIFSRVTPDTDLCSLLSSNDEFFPCQSVANRPLHLVDSLLRECCNLLHQVDF